MGFYNDRVLPYLIAWAMRRPDLSEYRARQIPLAAGRVLEIGMGSGLNLPFYSPAAREICGLEPAPKLIAMTRKRANAAAQPLALIAASAEQIPLADRSVDTVVSTWTLCTIPGVAQALGEVRRVLRPNGRLIFIEHGLAPDAGVRKWQHRLTPAWRRIGGGCHLDRPIAELIETAGFAIEQIETGYMPRAPKPWAFMSEGSARPR